MEPEVFIRTARLARRAIAPGSPLEPPAWADRTNQPARLCRRALRRHSACTPHVTPGDRRRPADTPLIACWVRLSPGISARFKCFRCGLAGDFKRFHCKMTQNSCFYQPNRNFLMICVLHGTVATHSSPLRTAKLTQVPCVRMLDRSGIRRFGNRGITKWPTATALRQPTG